MFRNTELRKNKHYLTVGVEMKRDIHRIGQGRVKSGSNAEDKLFSDARATIIVMGLDDFDPLNLE